MNSHNNLISVFISTLIIMSAPTAEAQTEPLNCNNIPQTINQINTFDTLENINLHQLHKAQNWARMAAEKANGGLTNYRAEKAMHGAVEKAPFKYHGDGNFMFTISGKSPTDTDYTITTVVTVNLISNTVTVNSNTNSSDQLK